MKRRTKKVRFGLLPLCIFAAAMMLYTMSAQAASADKYSIADAVRLVKYLTCQNTELTSEQAQLLDIDGNQKLSAVDMTLLKRILIYGEAEEKENTTSTTTETTTASAMTETTTTKTTTSVITTTETTVSTDNPTLSLLKEIIQKITITDTVEPPCNTDLFKVIERQNGYKSVFK